MAYFVERYDREDGWGLPKNAHAYNLADASRRADSLDNDARDRVQSQHGLVPPGLLWARVVDENRRVWTTEMVENGGPVTTHALVCPNCGQEVR
jgi:hypothetical protein